MRFRVTFFVVIVLALAPAPAWSILIETESKQRIGGFFVNDDGAKLTIRVKSPTGKDKIEVYDKAKIQLIHQVDRSRLEKLSKDDPQAYRDYADELAKKTGDPEARELAMRLYVIAAHLDPAKQASGCLLSMSTLAESTAEARRYLALAYVFDPKGDAALLKQETAKPPVAAKIEAKTKVTALADFQQAFRFYRIGELDTAKAFAKRDGVPALFGLAPGMMNLTEFVQVCDDAICSACRFNKRIKCNRCNGSGKIFDASGIRPVTCVTCNGTKAINCPSCTGTGVKQTYPEEKLQVMIRAELWAVEQSLAADSGPKKPADDNWSNLLSGQPLAPAPVLSLEAITAFDPRQCIFRKGSWIAP